MKKALFILSVAAVAGCNMSSDRKSGNDADTAGIATETLHSQKSLFTGNPKGCYRYTAVRDTYDIKINGSGNNVNGMMHFNNFEKDDSRGNFTGTAINDSVFKLIYKFESEGMQSTREVFLKYNGNEMITGIGEEDVNGDSAYIKDPAALSFTGAVYQKIDCSKMQ